MITVRTGAYSKEDLDFLSKVLVSGLEKSCYNYSYGCNTLVCAECKARIACKEAQSALHHTLAVLYSKQALDLNEENKTLLKI